MSQRRKSLLLALLSLYTTQVFAVSDSALQQKLLDQAHFWEQRGRDDNAADAWQKLLKIDPANADAMVALGAREARLGNAEQAKNYLARLRDVKASAAQVRQLEEAIRRGASGTKSQLEDARKLAKQGDTEAAVESYRALGDPSRLRGDAALEYFQTLAGTLSGYPEARKGLEKLAKENPGNTRYALAYAQALTYRDQSRPEGLHQLEQLTSKPDVARAARDSWRQALSWMGLQTSNMRYFQSYLDKFPDDKTIQEKLTALKNHQQEAQNEKNRESRHREKSVRPPVENLVAKQQAAGFKALDDNDLATAEKEFDALMKSHPKDPSGYGGMGLVKMRQEEFIESRKLLSKAVSMSSGKGASNWKQAYDSANYWALTEEARNAFEDGESLKGIGLLKKAVALNPKEPSGILQLADALKAENDLAGAEENYKRVFTDDKTNTRAIDGLVGIYSLQKRVQDLDALSPFMIPRQLAILANSKAEELLEKAKKAEAAGDLATAQSALEDAILVKPEDAWLRMGLAKLYQKQNMPGQARALLDALTNVEKPDPEALYVSAMLSEMQSLWWEGMVTLERIPEKSRNAAMTSLQKRLWLKVQLDRLDAMNKRGYTDQVRELLARVDAAAANDPEFVGTIASLYIRLGDKERGFSMIKQLVQNTKEPKAGLMLQYASVLMQMNQEAELEAVMRKVAAMPKLSEDEVLSFRQLQRALAMRYSERAREAGDYAAAYTYIQPMLIESPEDNLLLLTLARIYSSAGDTDPARELYQKVMETDPENPEVLQGLVFAAIQVKDLDGAQRYLDTLMKLQPENPRFVALAGNVARAKGQNSKALGYFKKALAMEQAQRPLAGKSDQIRLVDSAAPAVTDFKVNPFAEKQAEAKAAVVKPVVPGPVLREVPQLGPQHQIPQAPKPVQPNSAVVPASAVATAAQPALKPVQTASATTAAVSPAPVLTQVPTPTLNRSVEAPVALAQAASQAQVTVPSAPRAQTAQVALPAAQAQTTTRRVTTASAKSRQQPDVSPEELALQKEIDSLSELNRSEVTAGVSLRARSGQSGLSQMKTTEVPIEGHLTTLGMGNFGLKIIPVVLDSGTLDLNDTNVAGQYGKNLILNERAKFAGTPFTTVAKAQGLNSVAAIQQEARGTALQISYELNGFKLDLGSSPSGFPVRNVVGGIKWSGQFDGVGVSAELSRRSVTDSILSFAGASDSVYQLQWGGVTKNGGRFDVSYDTDEGGIYGGAGAYALTGKNVVRNSSVDAGGGVYWKALKTKDSMLTAGVGMTAMFYRQNLRYFTYGHGGYFSPQSYLALNVPVEWSGRSGKLSYLFGGAVGVQHFKEDASLIYPFSPADQAELVQFAAANPTLNIATSYKGQTHTGLQYKLMGSLEYLFNPYFALGGRFSVDNSGDFTDAAGMIYLRYTFEPRRSAPAFPPVVPRNYTQQGN